MVAVAGCTGATPGWPGTIPGCTGATGGAGAGARTILWGSSLAELLGDGKYSGGATLLGPACPTALSLAHRANCCGAWIKSSLEKMSVTAIPAAGSCSGNANLPLAVRSISARCHSIVIGTLVDALFFAGMMRIQVTMRRLSISSVNETRISMRLMRAFAAHGRRFLTIMSIGFGFRHPYVFRSAWTHMPRMVF